MKIQSSILLICHLGYIELISKELIDKFVIIIKLNLKMQVFRRFSISFEAVISHA